ncbi:MAG: hypothetical protein ACM3NH_04865 [Candidatus Saccharibacteria bacterium]
MNKIALVSGVLLSLALTAPALAAPFNAANNPNIVANYPTGDHGIAGEPVNHNGADVVMRAGNSGNFQQWFVGTAAENGGVTEGDHSVWMLSKDGSCPNDSWYKMTVGPGNFWGDYLVNGGTYCIHTNDFNGQPANHGM